MKFQLTEPFTITLPAGTVLEGTPVVEPPPVDPPPVDPPPTPDPPPDVHPDDPAKHDEHVAALALVPIVGATHTLSDGVMPVLPDDARVYIPEGVTVTVDRAHTERLLWIRVNGTLRFARDVQADLNCDTCVVDVTGWIDLGTNESKQSKPLTWTFIDNGPVSDPMQLGRGIVCHGRFDCVCADGVEVTLRSENPDLMHRGHIMQMHAPKMTLDGLRIIDCGRSNKNENITDFPNVANLRARYPLHAHRCGLKVPMTWRRVTVERSPGWGIVNHESWVECEDSVCRDIQGAGFVAETGRERGVFRRCLAEDMHGPTGNLVEVELGTRESGAKDDWGVNGHGFWLQGGGGVALEDVVARRCDDAGIIVMGRGFDGGPDSIASVMVPLDELDSEAFPLLSSAGSIWPFGAAVQPFDIPVRIHGAKLSECGLRGTKRGFGMWNNCNPSAHSFERGIVEDLQLDGCYAINGYANRTDYVRFESVGDVNDPIPLCAFGHTGRTFDVRLIDADIRGWAIGYQAPTDGQNKIKGGTWQNIIDVLVTNKVTHDRPPGRTLTIDIPDENFLPLPEGVDAKAFGPVNFNGPLPIEPGRYHVCLVPVHVWFDIRNTTQPSAWWPNLFGAETTFFLPDKTTFNGRRLVYEEWCRDAPLPGMIPQSIRGRYATSGELYDATGAALYQRVPVVGEPEEFVRGRFVESVEVLEKPVVPEE